MTLVLVFLAVAGVMVAVSFLFTVWTARRVEALLPPRGRVVGLIVGAAFGLCFAGAALAMQAGFYGSFQ